MATMEPLDQEGEGWGDDDELVIDEGQWVWSSLLV